MSNKKKTYTFYTGENRDMLDSLFDSIKKDWYMKYGESLSINEIIMKGLIVFKDYIRNETKYGKKEMKPSDKYFRINDNKK